MRRYLVVPIVIAVMWIVAAALWAGTPGTFRGIVVVGPQHQANWIMVMGAHGQLRRVSIEGAEVVYNKSVPTKERLKSPKLSIVHGADVRITADQDGHGQWRAKRIEILNLHADPPLRLAPPSKKLLKI